MPEADHQPNEFQPGKREYLFGPTEILLIIKVGRRFSQEQGWTRCHRVVDNKDSEVLWLEGLGLKTADYPLQDINIYRVYPQLATDKPFVLQFDSTVVKEDLRRTALWGSFKATTLDPLLTNNMYFAENFCNPTIKTPDPEEPTN